MWKWFLLCILTCLSRGVHASLATQMKDMTQLCCNQGTGYARNHTSEDCSPSMPPDVPAKFGDFCIFAMDQCCKEYVQKKRDCDTGIDIASSTRRCDSTNDSTKNCCDECMKGASVGTSRGNNACQVGSQGSSAEQLLAHDAFAQCCKKTAKENGDAEARTPQRSNNRVTVQSPKKPTDSDLSSVCEEYAPNELCAHHCIPIPGSYKCECNAGFMLMSDGRNCKEVVKNRCKPRNPCQHKCNDNGVAVKCSCRRGYELMSDGKSCQDIDECLLDPPVCLPGTQCYNIQGSYKCIPVKKNNNVEKGQCPSGFARNLNNNACDDINECDLPHPPCPQYICENTIGAYKCGGVTGDPANLANKPRPAPEDRCPPGFRAGLNEECEDVDECATRKNDCNPLSQFCINTRGSFYCQDRVSKHCPPGFKIDPRTNKCEDINECEDGQDICRPDQVCVNVPGEYDCKLKVDQSRKQNQCPEGMRIKHGGRVCEDIDECVEGTHLCDQYQNCLNTNGSHECHCKLGFELDSTTGACTDVNECATDQHNCIPESQRCDNTVGSFLCVRFTSCGTGYILHHSTSKCEDIDECALGTHNCARAGPEYQCVNIPGSFRCIRRRPSTTSSTTTPEPEYEYEYYDSEEEIEGNQTSSQSGNKSEKKDEPSTTTTPKPEPPSETPPTTPSTKPTEASPPPTEPSPPPTEPSPPPTEPSPVTPIEPRHEQRQDNSVDDTFNYIVPPGQQTPRESYQPETPSQTEPPRQPEISYSEPKEPEIQQPTYYEPQQPEPQQPQPQQPEPQQPEPQQPEPQQPEPQQPEPQQPEPQQPEPQQPELQQPEPQQPEPQQPEPQQPEPQQPEPQQPEPQQPEFQQPTYYEPRPDQPRQPDQSTYYETNDPQTPKEPDEPKFNELEPPSNNNPRQQYGPQQPETTYSPIPERTTPPQVVYVDVGRETATVKGEKAKDGAVFIDTQNVPKNKWTTINEKPADCQIGFEMDDYGACFDIDECSTNRHSCSGLTEVCRNTMGGYLCDCAPGFRRDFHSGICALIVTTSSTTTSTTTPPPPPSPAPTTPRNFFWGYPDYRPPTTRPFRPRNLCDVGYHLNSKTGRCEDINECVNGQANCANVEICVNTQGGYRCECLPNWKLDQVRHRCMPIRNNGQFPPGYGNEPVYPPVNPDEVIKHDTKGTKYVEPKYTHLGDRGSVIKCPWGFRLGDDNTCEDIDECVTGEARCGPMQLCTNLPGGYTCSCPRGHKLVGDHECHDVDECSLAGNVPICSQNADCVNTVGSYQCRCHNGFRAAPANDKVCVDVDECTELRAGSLCQHRCNNVWGGYRCSCHRGYRLNADNSTCSDVDECTEFKTKILCVGRCLNEPGSYRCTCPAGYRLSEDKRSCIDIDECETGEAPCAKSGVYGGVSDVCLNTRGGYRCQRIICPNGYRLDGRHRCTKIERVCPPADWDCAHQPTTYSYNFITFVSKLYIPASKVDLFTMRGPTWPYAKMKFELRLMKVDAPPSVKEIANINSFLLVQTNNQAVVSLVRSLEGPQSIELELSMELYNHEQFGGIAVARLYIYVSEYEF